MVRTKDIFEEVSQFIHLFKDKTKGENQILQQFLSLFESFKKRVSSVEGCFDELRQFTEYHTLKYGGVTSEAATESRSKLQMSAKIVLDKLDEC